MKINYKVKGKGLDIVLLHGWAKTASLESLKDLQNKLAEKGYRVWALDLPGFGGTAKAPDDWSTPDFAKLVNAFIQDQILKDDETKKYYLFGHSFGGSLTAYIAANLAPKPEKIVLCSSAGLRHKSLKAKLLLPIAKIFKIFLKVLPKGIASKLKQNVYYYLIRERDYIDTRDKKQQYLNITNFDLAKTFEAVKVPTLIIWGKDDKVTPINMAHKINDLINKSRLEIIDGKHGIPITAPDKIAKLVKTFIE